jgi:glycosyltransferase involved in cell wall biosynthesis
MRILFVCDTVNPYGGPSQVVRSLAKELVKNGFHIGILGEVRDDPEEGIEMDPHIELFAVQGDLRPSSFFSGFFESHLIFKSIVDRYDVIHFHVNPHAKYLFIPFLTKSFDKPIVRTFHGIPSIQLKLLRKKAFAGYLFSYLSSRLNTEYIDNVIVNSKNMKHLIDRKYHKNATIIPNGVNIHDFEKQVESNYNLEGEQNIVYWGRLSSIKGVDLLVKSATIVRKSFPKCHFYLVGDGEQLMELKQLCDALDVQDIIHFTGFMPRCILSHIVTCSDLVCFPSRYEPFGLMVLEAMAMKKAIVATSVGGIPDMIVDGYNGVLVDPTPEDIADGICALLENGSLRRSLSFNAYETAEAHSWDRIVKNYIQYYGELI